MGVGNEKLKMRILAFGKLYGFFVTVNAGYLAFFKVFGNFGSEDGRGAADIQDALCFFGQETCNLIKFLAVPEFLQEIFLDTLIVIVWGNLGPNLF